MIVLDGGCDQRMSCQQSLSSRVRGFGWLIRRHLVELGPMVWMGCVEGNDGFSMMCGFDSLGDNAGNMWAQFFENI